MATATPIKWRKLAPTETYRGLYGIECRAGKHTVLQAVIEDDTITVTNDPDQGKRWSCGISSGGGFQGFDTAKDAQERAVAFATGSG